MKTKKNILIVDDDIQVLNGIKRVFLEDKYNVRSADNVDDALVLLNKKKYDLVITDIIMHGSDGLVLLQEIKKMDSNIVAVALTGYGLEKIVNAAKEMGADYVILKPCEGHELRRVVKELLNKKNDID